MTGTALPGLTWAVTDEQGQPVATLNGLATVLGVDRKDAAQALLSCDFQSVAPARLRLEAICEAKKKPNPFTEGGGDKPPPISNGSFVSWDGGRGRVDLVVTNGKVPGVGGDEDVEGTPDSPAARVVVYAEDTGGWKATGRKVAVKVATLKRMPPFARTAKKDAPAPEEQLVAMLAEHETKAAERGCDAVPDGSAVLAVYQRGLSAWPGEQRTTLTAQQWGLARARTFLAKALGDHVDGYTRDDDLLPAPPSIPVVEGKADDGMLRWPRGEVDALLGGLSD